MPAERRSFFFNTSAHADGDRQEGTVCRSEGSLKTRLTETLFSDAAPSDPIWTPRRSPSARAEKSAKKNGRALHHSAWTMTVSLMAESFRSKAQSSFELESWYANTKMSGRAGICNTRSWPV